MTDQSIYAYISGKKPIIEKALDHLLTPPPGNRAERVYQSMRYTVLNGGKRLRAILVMATAEALKHRATSVVKAACATEFVHACSLILDDLPSMDNATMRRGRPANHLEFGEATAVLAADALLMESLNLVSDNCTEVALPADLTARAVRALADAVGPEGMIGGQHVDLEIAGRSADFETLEYVCSHKTGALFTLCVQLGALLSRAREFEIQALENYAKNLGLAFQIRDDILDEVGDPDSLGKNVHQDAGRTTFATQFGIDAARKAVHDLCNVAVDSLQALPVKSAPLVALARYVSETEE